jgi:hypothetical protein
MLRLYSKAYFLFVIDQPLKLQRSTLNLQLLNTSRFRSYGAWILREELFSTDVPLLRSFFPNQPSNLRQGYGRQATFQLFNFSTLQLSTFNFYALQDFAPTELGFYGRNCFLQMCRSYGAFSRINLPTFAKATVGRQLFNSSTFNFQLLCASRFRSYGAWILREELFPTDVPLLRSFFPNQPSNLRQGYGRQATFQLFNFQLSTFNFLYLLLNDLHNVIFVLIANQEE